MKLSTENLENVIIKCLFNEGEDTSIAVRGEGVHIKIGFHPERIKQQRENIKSMLLDLPEQFMATKGGGYTFLNACDNKEGVQWTGMHSEVDKLVALGQAADLVYFTMPREMWDVLPGGMPYFTVKDN